VAFTDHGVDLSFVLGEEGVNVGFVDEHTALLSGSNQIEVDTEAEPAVKRDPVQDEVELIFNEEEDAESGPVHKPWCEDTRVGGTKSFVGEEDGKEDGEDGAAMYMSVAALISRSVGFCIREDVRDEPEHGGCAGWWVVFGG
jgi:hypothetical protein